MNKCGKIVVWKRVYDMKRLFVVLLALCLVGCGGSKNVNASAKDVIDGYIDGMIKQDKELLEQCIDDNSSLNTGR